MPTYRNDSSRVVMYKGVIRRADGRTQEQLVIVDPGKEIAVEYWIPYEKLGLMLVKENEPPVPSTVLLSGTFMFDEGTERKYPIEPCDAYVLNVIVQRGKVKVYPGNTAIGVELSSELEVPYHYRGFYDWEYAPYLRVVGLEDDTAVTINAEVSRYLREAGL